MSQTTSEINKITSTIISISGRLIVYALVFILLFEGITRGYAFGYEIFSPTPVGGKYINSSSAIEKTVEIPEGTTVTEAAKILKKKGLIKDELVFRVQAIFYEYEIQPGSYVVSTAMDSREILMQLNDPQTEEEEK